VIYVDPAAVPPLTAREAAGGWTLFDVRSIDVLRGPTLPVRLPRAEAERVAKQYLARPGQALPPSPIADPETAP